MSPDDRIVVRVEEERSAKRLKSVAEEEGSPVAVSVVLSETYHRTVYDYSTRNAIRDALQQSLESRPDDDGEAPIRDWIVDDIDPSTQHDQDLEHEVERLVDLKSYLILDTVGADSRETPFDHLAETAERLFDKRFACAVTLVDMGRQYFLNYSPVIGRVIPRTTGFCRHALLHKDDVMVVKDCLLDDRFRENPFVKGNLNMRFYAGAPIVSTRGYRLGAFCLAGGKPYPEGLTEKEKRTLKDFAKLSMEAIENNRIIRTQQMQLKQASRALASAAHDLLTPLTGIQLSTTILTGDPEFTRRLRDSERECLRTTGTCVDAMALICDTLRNTEVALSPQTNKTVPLLMDGRKKSPTSVFNIHETIERLHQVMNSAPRKAPLFVSVDPSVPLLVVGDELTIFRASLNLLCVASQRTVSGFVRFSVYVESGQSGGNLRLVFECEDTGPLIDREHKTSKTSQQQLLAYTDEEWIMRTTNSTCTDQSASSFYHLISHLDALQCTLDIIPNLNEGSVRPPSTSFYFRLPLVLPESSTEVFPDPIPVAKEDLQIEIPADVSAMSEVRPRRALVVDDSPVIRKLLGRALSKLGIESSMACNGLEGLTIMKDHLYDFVLLDFLMPVMDGLDVIRELRLWESRERPNFRQCVIGISAHASENDAEHGIVLGMNSYHNKPLKLQDLQKIANSDDVIAAGKLLDRMSQKRKTASNQTITTSPQKSCLIGTGDFFRDGLSETVQGLGWLPVAASSKDDFLHQLRSRNWDAILVDGDLSDFVTSLHEFREWESCNRVRRQHNLFLLSSGYTQTRASALSLVELPSGVDGVLGKPTSPIELKKMLSMASKGNDSIEFSKRDIVTR